MHLNFRDCDLDPEQISRKIRTFKVFLDKVAITLTRSARHITGTKGVTVPYWKILESYFPLFLQIYHPRAHSLYTMFPLKMWTLQFSFQMMWTLQCSLLIKCEHFSFHIQSNVNNQVSSFTQMWTLQLGGVPADWAGGGVRQENLPLQPAGILVPHSSQQVPEVPGTSLHLSTPASRYLTSFKP